MKVESLEFGDDDTQRPEKPELKILTKLVIWGESITCMSDSQLSDESDTELSTLWQLVSKGVRDMSEHTRARFEEEQSQSIDTAAAFSLLRLSMLQGADIVVAVVLQGDDDDDDDRACCCCWYSWATVADKRLADSMCDGVVENCS